MKKLIKNEIIKLHFKRKLLLTFVILAAISALICYGHYKSNYNMEKFNNPKQRSEILQNDISTMEKEKEKADNKTKTEIDLKISDMKQEIDRLKIQDTNNSADWKGDLQNNINTLQDQRKNFSSVSDDNLKENVNKDILVFNYLLKHNIKPENSYVTTGFSAFKNLSIAYGTIFLIIIVAILTSDIVSSEYTPPTMKVLLTRPISRGKILLSKFISAILASIAVIFSVELLCFIIMGIIFGFGNPSYPVVVGTTFKNSILKSSEFGNSIVPVLGSSHIVPIWLFIIEILLMQIIFIITTVSFCFLLSTVLRSSMLSMSLSIVISIVLTIVVQIPILNKISPFIFSVYSNSISVLQGDIALAYRNPLITPSFSIIILLIWNIICYLISHIIFVKKDLLI